MTSQQKPFKNVIIATSLCLFLAFGCKQNKNEAAAADTDSIEITEQDTVASSQQQWKLSLAQWSIHTPIYENTMDPMEFAAYAKKLGFSGLEYVDQLYPKVDSLSYQEWVMNLASAWKEKSDAVGIENVLIMLDTAGELADPSVEKRNEAVTKHKYWVDAAALIDAKALRVNLFGLTEVDAWHDASVQSLKDLSAYAATKNVKILVENHAQLSNDASLVVKVIKAVNMDNCGTLPDFGNFCVEREGGDRWGTAPCIKEYDAYQGIAELMPYAGGVSAKSYFFDQKGDETQIDYYRMMQIVKDANFSGYIGIEYEDDDIIDPTEGILATKALVEKALAAAK